MSEYADSVTPFQRNNARVTHISRHFFDYEKKLLDWFRPIKQHIFPDKRDGSPLQLYYTIFVSISLFRSLGRETKAMLLDSFENLDEDVIKLFPLSEKNSYILLIKAAFFASVKFDQLFKDFKIKFQSYEEDLKSQTPKENFEYKQYEPTLPIQPVTPESFPDIQPGKFMFSCVPRCVPNFSIHIFSDEPITHFSLIPQMPTHWYFGTRTISVFDKEDIQYYQNNYFVWLDQHSVFEKKDDKYHLKRFRSALQVRRNIRLVAKYAQTKVYKLMLGDNDSRILGCELPADPLNQNKNLIRFFQLVSHEEGKSILNKPQLVKNLIERGCSL